MPRDYRSHEKELRSKARRQSALARNELRGPTEPRSAPAGATSMPIKITDPATAEMIEQFLAKRGATT